MNQSGRLSYIDWLRFIVVLSLTPFHAAIAYTGAGTIFVYDSAITEKIVNGTLRWDSGPAFLRYYTMFMDNWFMHLLFFISGVAAVYSLKKRTASGFVWERVSQLLWPFTVGILTVIPLQSWLSALSVGHFSGSFIDFYPVFFNAPYTGPTGYGNFGFGHFWFLIYLFCFSVVALPLFMAFDRFRGSASRKGSPVPPAGIVVFAFALWIGFLEALFRPGWPGFQNLVNDWANFTVYLSFFVFGFIAGKHGRLLEAMETKRRFAVAIGVLAFASRVLLYRYARVMDGYNSLNAIVQSLRGISSCAFVFAAIGYGRKWLNAESAGLRLARNASFPLYFLHFAFLSAVTYALNRTPLSAVARLILSILSTYALVMLSALIMGFVPGVRDFFRIKRRPPENAA